MNFASRNPSARLLYPRRMTARRDTTRVLRGFAASSVLWSRALPNMGDST